MTKSGLDVSIVDFLSVYCSFHAVVLISVSSQEDVSLITSMFVETAQGCTSSLKVALKCIFVELFIVIIIAW